MKKRIIGISALSVLSLILIGHVAGVRGNLSNSTPIGLWVKRPLTAELQRDMMIGACPPSTVAVVRLLSANGTCPMGSALKRTQPFS